jgi:hypothetical protein
MIRKMRKKIILLATFLLPLFVACSGRDGQLKPLRPGTEGELLLAAQPQLVTFTQLQEDPEAFQNRLLRVSGSLFKLPPPDCVPYSGPIIEWALIADALRLDAVGFENAVGLLVDGMPMTVDGTFRLYEGPLGCGKAAADGTGWYLEVLRIVQPNPLVASAPKPGGIIPNTTTPGVPIVPPGSTATPTGQTTPPITGTAGLVPTATATGTQPVVPTATVTPGPGTVTATSTPTGLPTVSVTPQLTPTPSPLPGTPTVTPTSVQGTTVPTPTPTVGQYPAPNTPTATPTVNGYPGPATVTMTPTGYP